MEKTPEQLMQEFRQQPTTLVSLPSDNHALALKAAMTFPNGSSGELLSNAEKIERWLNEPKNLPISASLKFTMTERPSTDGSPFPEIVTEILPPAAVEK